MILGKNIQTSYSLQTHLYNNIIGLLYYNIESDCILEIYLTEFGQLSEWSSVYLVPIQWNPDCLELIKRQRLLHQGFKY